ncbi:hypothetical protein C8Q73DRAFT_683160 [Cubamyces lactineus]|nr:hypothetical protein C8Q73DRAFT_683160 [Cubamyces lactineus]
MKMFGTARWPVFFCRWSWISLPPATWSSLWPPSRVSRQSFPVKENGATYSMALALVEVYFCANRVLAPLAYGLETFEKITIVLSAMCSQQSS